MKSGFENESTFLKPYDLHPVYHSIKLEILKSLLI